MDEILPPLPPGYFECLRALRRLGRFRDLYLHSHRWAHHPPATASLNRLIPQCPSGFDRAHLVAHELNLLVPQVSWDLRRAGVSTRVGPLGEEPARDVDLIASFDQLAQFRTGGNARIDDMMLACLDRGVGAYRARRSTAFWELFNPLLAIASVLKIPNYVLARAGMGGETMRNKMTEVYTWAFRIVFLLLLFLVAAKLGLTIPWDRVGSMIGVK